MNDRWINQKLKQVWKHIRNAKRH